MDSRQASSDNVAMKTYLTSILICLLLGACQGTVVSSNAGLPVAAATLPSDLHAVSAPAQIGAWQYQGDMLAEQRHLRLFRYQLAGEPGRVAQLTVYPMAPGWHEADPEQIIAGHFPLVREQALRQLAKKGVIDIEQTVSPLQASSATPYPIASALLRAHTSRRVIRQQVMLTGKQPWLIRLDVSSPTDSANGTNDSGLRLLETFVEQL